MPDRWPKFHDLQPSEELLLEPPSDQERLEADWQMLKGQESESHELPRMSPTRLKEFVLGVCDGSIFTSNQVPQSDIIGMVFMPLAMGGLIGWDENSIKKIGVIWEHMSKSLPRSINGMPIFASCSLMHTDDWKVASHAILEELDRRKNIKLDLQPEAEET
jgi:hypothetical protein